METQNEMKVGYLINQYPKVSHSFIRREIQALEKAGVTVNRYSIRSSIGELVDQGDKDEFSKTKFIFGKSLLSNCILSILKAVTRPWLFLKTLVLALKMGWRSERGLLKHALYFGEACIIARWCIENKTQHIHAHFGTNSAMVAMLAGKLAKIPYSFTVHGPEEFDKPEFISLGRKIESAAFVVGISSFGKSQLYRHTEASNWKKVNTVHCGIDEEFYEGGVAPIPSSCKKLVCVGRLCEQKGQLLLVEAAKELVRQEVEFHLTLVGDGPMRGDVEKLIMEYGLSSNITITGWMSSKEVRKEIESSIAMVLPSFAEGLPVVIMESMALSRPVISTYIAGIPELVTPKDNGWLIPAGDILSLVAAMKGALESSEQVLMEMGMSARKRVLERHNIDTEVAKLIPLFAKSISEKLVK